MTLIVYRFMKIFVKHFYQAILWKVFFLNDIEFVFIQFLIIRFNLFNKPSTYSIYDFINRG